MKWDGVWRAVALASGGSVTLFLFRVMLFGDLTFGYMNWNLFLAAMPLGLAVLLIGSLAKRSWLDKLNLLLTALWLGFLPNSFYVVTDLIHIAEVGQGTIVYDSVMLMMYAIAGLMLGYVSLIMVHQQLRRRLERRSADRLITVILLLCSFAIYLGRYMRWNTWDVLANPIGLVGNIVDSIIAPRSGSPLVQTTLLFFGFLGLLYVIILQLWPRILYQRSIAKDV